MGGQGAAPCQGGPEWQGRWAIGRVAAGWIVVVPGRSGAPEPSAPALQGGPGAVGLDVLLPLRRPSERVPGRRPRPQDRHEVQGLSFSKGPVLLAPMRRAWPTAALRRAAQAKAVGPVRCEHLGCRACLGQPKDCFESEDAVGRRRFWVVRMHRQERVVLLERFNPPNKPAPLKHSPLPYHQHIDVRK